jgi:hypothetical protein
MYERFVQKNENFRSAYIVGTKTMTRDLETKNYIKYNFFGREFFTGRAYSVCGLKYSDFYTNQDVMIPAETVIAATGVPLTAMMIQTLRGVCGVARTKYIKKELSERVCVDIRTFLTRGKRGSKRFRMLLTGGCCSEIPHNINKFARNMDIIVNGEQSAFLNSLWTNNFFNNNMKTFLFKFHNNTLGYNCAVAHFVRGQSPDCTFCNIAGDGNINIETGAHLFYECTYASTVIDSIFSRVTNVDNFAYSRRELFTTFERRDFTFSKNMALTILSKLVIKTLWDCKLRFCLPSVEDCWDLIQEEISALKSTNKKFLKIWNNTNFLP